MRHVDGLAHALRVARHGGRWGLGCALLYAPLAALTSVVLELAQGTPAFGLGGLGGSVSTFVVVLLYALLVAGPVGLVLGVLVAPVASACRRWVRPERTAVGLVALLWTTVALVAVRAGVDLRDPVVAVLLLAVPLSAAAAHRCCRRLPARTSDGA